MTVEIAPRTIRFKAEDGMELEGSIYQLSNPTTAVLISAGTGFLRSFYRHIASYLAHRGAIVLTYDYRGMGDSRPDNKTFLDIEYTDWGRMDTPAALNALADRSQTLPMTHLAHSVGGHFIGLMHNHEMITRHAFVSVGTGFFGGHHVRSIPVELYFWWILGPILLKKYGRIKTVGGWQGEELPPKLFKTWRRWSQRRSYFQSDLTSYMAPNHYNEISAPIRSWIFTDDPIATPSTGSDLLKVYPASKNSIMLRSPKDYGLRHLGHEGAFRKGRNNLWEEIWDWLETGI